MKHIPDWTRWLAMDSDGNWWCYEAEPHQHDNGWYENEVGRVSRYQGVQADAAGWRNSLRRVNCD